MKQSAWERAGSFSARSSARNSLTPPNTGNVSPTLPGSLKGEECYMKHKSLHRLFEENLKTNETTALIYEDEGVRQRETKYGGLNSNANQIANLFLEIIKQSPFKPNQDGDYAICVMAKASDMLVTVLLGILKTGAAYLPIDPNSPKARVEHIFNEAKPILVVHDDDFKHLELLADFRSIKLIDVTKEFPSMKSENILDEEMLTTEGEFQKALICFTSGSTGAQKGVRLSHYTLFHRINWQLITFPFTNDEQNFVFKTPISFIDHVGELWSPLISSKTLIVVPRDVVINFDKFITLLEERQVQRLIIIPNLLRYILITLKSKKSKTLLSMLRLWISSGEVLTKNIANDFFDYYSTKGNNILVNVYGATEALDCVVYEIASEKQIEKMDKIPVGLPVHNTMVYVINPNTREPVDEEGEVGEICISGLTLADGYVNNRSPKIFTKNTLMSSHKNYQRLYHTGDFGCIKNGMLYFEGREDSQVKISGMRVDLEEINLILGKLEYVQDAITLAYHQSLHDQTIISFIELKKVFDKAIKKDEEEILKDLIPFLLDFMLPKIFIVDTFPRFRNGKIDNQKLLSEYENSLPKEEFKVNFEYDLKNISRDKYQVAKNVFETIGISLGNDARMKLNVNSNFYQLGGSSLNTISTINELRQKGYHVDINEFLQAKNIGEIINHVSSSKRDNMKVKPDMKFFVEPFNQLDQSQCIQMLAEGYSEKSIFNQYISNMKHKYYREVLEYHFNSFLSNNFSFMVKNNDDEVIGVALLCNVTEKPVEFPPNPVKPIFDFIHSIERPTINNLLTESCLHIFMMGISHVLSPHTTIALVRYMETKIIEVAVKNDFKGILTTNTDPLTIEIGRDFGYKVTNEYQINRFTNSDGKKPFMRAPDNQIVAVMFKDLRIK